MEVQIPPNPKWCLAPLSYQSFWVIKTPGMFISLFLNYDFIFINILKANYFWFF